jgi:hypothetical protein
MAIQTLGNTRRFIVDFDDAIAGAAQPIAQVLMNNCEADSFRMNVYLPSHLGLGQDGFLLHPLVIRVQDTTIPGLSEPSGPPRGGAMNSGSAYSEDAFIRINAFSSFGAPIALDYARFLFIAELSEQIMKLYYNWDPRTGRGEALSRVMAEQLFPDAGYDTKSSVTPAPWVNNWLSQDPRPDFISIDDPSDTNPLSYGCGILFINYLRYQLNVPLFNICTFGGTSFADLYKGLTGRTDSPFNAMNDLLNKHFPKNVQLLNNNPFPLLEAADRKVLLSFGKTTSKSVPVGIGFAHVAPFFTCPAKDYNFTRFNHTLTKRVTATATGFGQPQFLWKVNKIPLGLDQGSLSTSGPVKVPGANSPTKTTGTFDFNYIQADSFTRTELSNNLQITNTTFEGDYIVDLRVEVKEAKDPAGAPATAETSVDFSAGSIQYSTPYYMDQAKCEKDFEHALSVVPKLETHIDVVLNLPNPPPDGYMTRVLEAIEGIRVEVEQLAEKDHAEAQRVAQFVGHKLNVPPTMFLKPSAGTAGTAVR